MDFKERLRLFYLILVIAAIAYFIFSHLLKGAGLYSIAKRRKLDNKLYAFIPVCNFMLMGNIAEQFEVAQYGKTKNYNKLMLILSLPFTITFSIYLVLLLIILPDALTIADFGATYAAGKLTLDIAGYTLLLTLIPFLGGQTFTLYKVYRSLKPDNCALYTILSATVCVSTPFSIYRFRKSDEGFLQLGYPKGSY